MQTAEAEREREGEREGERERGGADSGESKVKGERAWTETGRRASERAREEQGG